MATRTVFVVVDGGVAQVQYHGVEVLRPGDVLRIEVRDFDLEASEEEPTGYDNHGVPYIETDTVTFKVQE